jgi:polyisoprenoid-binding protein YceI
MKVKMSSTKWIVMIVMFVAPMTFMSFGIMDEPTKGQVFGLTNEKSTMNWRGTKPSGEHYGIVQLFSGSLDTDGKTITGGSFIIDMNSIVCKDLNNETFNKKLVGHLKSKDFFYTEKFPKAFFNITRVSIEKFIKDGFSATHNISGDLTIRGVTKEISFPANIHMDENEVFANSADIVLDRTEWNVNHMSKKVFSELKNKYVNDEMIISLNLRFDK